MKFKQWLTLTESKEEKALANELAGNALANLSEVIPQNTKETDPLLLLAAYYYNKSKNLEQIKRDIKEFESEGLELS